MNARSILYTPVAYLTVVLLLGFQSQTLAQTRLGLHVSEEELNIWRQRATSGPYRVLGDVSTNSPGDWLAIVSRARTFAANPLMDNWQGNTNGSPWRPSDSFICPYTQGVGISAGCTATFSQGMHMLAAGFATLVDPNNHNYASQIRQALLAQIAYPGVNWNNTNLWPDEQIGDGYNYTVGYMLSRMIFAYDYARMSQYGSVFSANDRLAIETWFSNAAYYWAKNNDWLIRNNAFPNRNTEYDTTVNTGGTYPTRIMPTTLSGTAFNYFNCNTNTTGPLSSNNIDLWNNRSASWNMFSALGSTINGTLPRDAQTQRWTKMWFKEWLTYASFPDGTFNDWKRGIQDNVYNQGWIYAAIVLGSMATTADNYARLGDPSLYNFSTSSGWTFTDSRGNTTGGPKSLLNALQTHAALLPQAATGTPNWRMGSTSAVCSNSALIIGPGGSNPSVHETHYIQANLFYKNNTLKSHYMRTSAGAPAYPSSPTTNSNPWGGVAAAYPGVLFMVGTMEGSVWPYGGASTPPVPPPPPSPPISSAIVVDSTFPGYNTSPIDDGIKDTVGGAATTWASAEDTTVPHWVEITFPASQQINTATIHWAYNDTTYMTSQQIEVQYWNGSSFITAANMTWSGKDVPSTTVTFPTVNTSKLRFYQPPNQGHPNYPEVIWLAEIDYGIVEPPPAPTNLLIAIE